MSKDLALSVALHLGIVALTFFTAPFAIKTPQEFGEVIRVSAVSMSDITPAEPEVIAPPEVPQAMEMAPEEKPIDDPTTKPEVEIEEPEPVEEQKPEPEPEQPPRQQASRRGCQTGRVQVGREYR